MLVDSYRSEFRQLDRKMRFAMGFRGVTTRNESNFPVGETRQINSRKIILGQKREKLLYVSLNLVSVMIFSNEYVLYANIV